MVIIGLVKKKDCLAVELILIKKRIIMKKVLLFVAVVALGFTSCSKKTDCECTEDGVTSTTSLDEANMDSTIELDQDQFEALCDLVPDCKMV